MNMGCTTIYIYTTDFLFFPQWVLCQAHGRVGVCCVLCVVCCVPSALLSLERRPVIAHWCHFCVVYCSRGVYEQHSSIRLWAVDKKNILIHGKIEERVSVNYKLNLLLRTVIVRWGMYWTPTTSTLSRHPGRIAAILLPSFLCHLSL